jgi:hypothetical protein
MKRCPKCGQVYPDADINFCLADGELLSHNLDGGQGVAFERDADDSPPTLLMDPPRVTNQTNWPGTAPMSQWQEQKPVYQSPQFLANSFTPSRDQTLPIVAIILGVASVLFVCCHGGVWLGIPAAIVGFLGMRNADNKPDRYAGKGLAIGGMILGTITFLGSIVLVLVAILAG